MNPSDSDTCYYLNELYSQINPYTKYIYFLVQNKLKLFLRVQDKKYSHIHRYNQYF